MSHKLELCVHERVVALNECVDCELDAALERVAALEAALDSIDMIAMNLRQQEGLSELVSSVLRSICEHARATLEGRRLTPL